MSNPIWDVLFPRHAGKKKIRELVASLPLFEDLTDYEITKLLAYLYKRSYHTKEPIFDEGVPGATVYIIESGTVEIVRNMGKTHEVVLAEIPEENFFGELALVDELPRATAARAKNDLTLWALSKVDLKDLSNHAPRLVLKIMENVGKLLVQRLSYAQTEIDQLKKNTPTATFR